MRLLCVALLTASCGGGRARTAPPPARPCVALAEARTAEAAASERNRNSLLAAIAARDLELLPVTGDVVDVQRGEEYGWRTKQTPSGGTVVLAPVGHEACGHRPSHELVRNQSGEVWAVEPVARATSQREVDTCACMSTQPITCGGAAPAPIQLSYALPEGLVFRGALSVEYDVEDLRVVFADMRGGSSCPPMPPPPP